MQTIERRVTALETEATDDSLKLVFQADGQTEAEALAKAGYPPDAKRVIFMSPVDAML